MFKNFVKYFFIIIFIIVFIFPIYYLFVNTTLSWQEFRYSLKPILIPKSFDFELFISSFKRKEFINSIIISSATTFLSVVMGTMAGYSFARFKIGGFHLPFMILSIRMLPIVAFIIPVFFITFKLNLIDTYLPIILSHLILCLPFAVWMMRSFFIEMPVEIEEAATIDGCSNWQILWQIAFPLVAPGIAVTALFCFIYSWNEFIFGLVLSRKEVIPITVSLTGGLSRQSSSLALVSILPVLLFLYALA